MTVMDERPAASTGFKKKVYRKLDSSPLAGANPASSIPSMQDKEPPVMGNRIVSSSGVTGLREEFKKTFLPLLIDIFELRQMIENVKNQGASSVQLPIGKTPKSPEQILERLTLLQSEIEESQRWCEGVIVQISKGIKEAKEALKYVEELNESEPVNGPLPKRSFWRALFRPWSDS